MLSPKVRCMRREMFAVETVSSSRDNNEETYKLFDIGSDGDVVASECAGFGSGGENRSLCADPAGGGRPHARTGSGKERRRRLRSRVWRWSDRRHRGKEIWRQGDWL